MCLFVWVCLFVPMCLLCAVCYLNRDVWCGVLCVACCTQPQSRTWSIADSDTGSAGLHSVDTLDRGDGGDHAHLVHPTALDRPAPDGVDTTAARDDGSNNPTPSTAAPTTTTVVLTPLSPAMISGTAPPPSSTAVAAPVAASFPSLSHQEPPPGVASAAGNSGPSVPSTYTLSGTVPPLPSAATPAEAPQRPDAAPVSGVLASDGGVAASAVAAAVPHT